MSAKHKKYIRKKISAVHTSYDFFNRASGGQSEEEFIHSIQDVAGAMCQALERQNENIVQTQVTVARQTVKSPALSSRLLMNSDFILSLMRESCVRDYVCRTLISIVHSQVFV